MSLIQMRDKAQITIPSHIRKEMGIKQGDYFEVIRENDKIVLIPKMIIDKNTISLSEIGENYLKEAFNEVKEGKTEGHVNVDDMINDLKKK